MQLKLTSEKGCGGPFYPEAFSPDTPATPPPCLQKELKYIVIKLLFTIYRVSQINLTPRQHVPGGRGGARRNSSGNLAAEDAAEYMGGDDFTRELTNVKSHRAWKTRLQAPPAGQNGWDFCMQRSALPLN